MNFILSVKFPFRLYSLPFKIRRYCWGSFRQTIQRAVRNTARGALLTTHSMAEAEAVCDRVAIMVSGRLRWVPAKPALDF